MRSLLKFKMAIALTLFAGYVVHVEPNVAQDPYGATTRAVGRLMTICDRNPQECALASQTAQRVRRFGEIGWGLASGRGQLVYVTDGRAIAAGAGRSPPALYNGDTGHAACPARRYGDSPAAAGQGLSISALLGGPA